MKKKTTTPKPASKPAPITYEAQVTKLAKEYMAAKAKMKTAMGKLQGLEFGLLKMAAIIQPTDYFSLSSFLGAEKDEGDKMANLIGLAKNADKGLAILESFDPETLASTTLPKPLKPFTEATK
jgi:hypothetical protein